MLTCCLAVSLLAYNFCYFQRKLAVSWALNCSFCPLYLLFFIFQASLPHTRLLSYEHGVSSMQYPCSRFKYNVPQVWLLIELQDATRLVNLATCSSDPNLDAARSRGEAKKVLRRCASLTAVSSARPAYYIDIRAIITFVGISGIV